MADLPPQRVWRARDNSLMSWRPLVDLIEVHEAPAGKILRLELRGESHELHLPQAAADHLARLLAAKAAA